MSGVCLDVRNFTSLGTYHNDIGIDTINELVADLHRHEDFIGAERSLILDSIEDDITTELTSAYFGKNVMMSALLSIGHNLLDLIHVQNDEYFWCDRDGDVYSGRDEIFGFPAALNNFWGWPGVIYNIRSILQQLVCKCGTDPIGIDANFTAFIQFPSPRPETLDNLVSTGADNNNNIAYRRFLDNEGACDGWPWNPFTGPRGSANWPYYTREHLDDFAWNVFSDCAGAVNKKTRYESGNDPRLRTIYWYKHGGNGPDRPVPEDIPLRLVKSTLNVELIYVGGFPNLRPMIDNEISMNITIRINNKTFFDGELSAHDTNIFPLGPPTHANWEFRLFSGARYTTNDWGDLSPSDFLLHSDQDRVQIILNHSKLSYIWPPFNENDPREMTRKIIRIHSLILYLKVRRPLYE